jgi:protein-disulfide isomerase
MAPRRQCCTLGAMRNWLALLVSLLAISCAANSANGSAAPNGSAPNEVDLTSLTAHERSDYSELVHSLLAPCPELPQSLSECVERRSACNACLPASLFIREAISRGRTPPQVEAAFRIRFDPKSVVALDTANSPRRGHPNAPIVIVEWADFECPFCAHASSFFEDIMKQRPGKVSVVFKYFPLSSHPHGELTACAAAAADLQGKFWPMHNQLFENQASIDAAKIHEIAGKIGLDLPKFEQDLTSDEVKRRVDKDRAEADRLGLEGTPFIWVNGRHVDSKSFNLEDDLLPWIDLELKLHSETASAK